MAEPSRESNQKPHSLKSCTPPTELLGIAKSLIKTDPKDPNSTKFPTNIVTLVGWLVVLRFNATLTAKVISWWSVTHTCFLAFSHQY